MVFCSIFFFFNDTATTEIYTLSLHDALPIYLLKIRRFLDDTFAYDAGKSDAHSGERDRKSTRLNSSHDQISYAVFCLKKKKNHVEVDYVISEIEYTTTDAANYYLSLLHLWTY